MLNKHQIHKMMESVQHSNTPIMAGMLQTVFPEFRYEDYVSEAELVAFAAPTTEWPEEGYSYDWNGATLLKDVPAWISEGRPYDPPIDMTAYTVLALCYEKAQWE